jgi:hypothetical protein
MAMLNNHRVIYSEIICILDILTACFFWRNIPPKTIVSCFLWTRILHIARTLRNTLVYGRMHRFDMAKTVGAPTWSCWGANHRQYIKGYSVMRLSSLSCRCNMFYQHSILRMISEIQPSQLGICRMRAAIDWFLSYESWWVAWFCSPQ